LKFQSLKAKNKLKDKNKPKVEMLQLKHTEMLTEELRASLKK
jgi:hypothetical protein